MDRESISRMVLAVVISVGLMLVFQYIIAPRLSPPGETPAGQPASKPPAEKPAPESPAPEKPKPGNITSEPPSPEAPAPESRRAGTEEPVPAAAKAPELVAVGATGEEAQKPAVMGSSLYGSEYNLEVHVTPRGGAVQRLSLARDRFFKTVADRGEKDPDKRQTMDLVETSAPFPAFLIPELRVWFAGADGPSRVDLSEAVWRVEKSGPTEVVLSVEVHKADGTPALRVVRRYTLRPRAEPNAEAAEGDADVPQYEMRMKVELAAADEQVEQVMYVIQGPPPLPEEGTRGGAPVAVVGKWEKAAVAVTSVAAKDVDKGASLPAVQNLAGPEVAWVGDMGKYFAVVMVPQKPSPEGTFADGGEAAWLRVAEPRQDRAMPVVRLLSKKLPLAVGQPLVHEVVVYAGPKDADHLEKYYSALALDKLIQWGSCCGIPGLSLISRFLAQVLDAFHGLVRNYGLAIIMLVVVLRFVLHPVTRWSSRSMAQMQALQPKVQKIREEFAHDQKRMQEEMAKIGGFKAMGGCLPMFLQTPIWIALYSALGVAISLRHAYFIPPSWLPTDSIVSMFLQDLSVPDRFLQWTTPFFLPGQEIPYIGTWVIGGIQKMLAGGESGITSFNVLPVFVGASMYLQQKMTPQAPAAGPQADQQRKMMNLMSVFFALMLYSLPSGLCLYISVSSFLGFFEQRYLKKKFAAAAVAVKSGEPSPPKPPKKAGSLVAGRNKSIAERIEAWLERRRAGGKK